MTLKKFRLTLQCKLLVRIRFFYNDDGVDREGAPGHCGDNFTDDRARDGDGVEVQGEGPRLIEGGGARVDDTKVLGHRVDPPSGSLVKVGKRLLARVE